MTYFILYIVVRWIKLYIFVGVGHGWIWYYALVHSYWMWHFLVWECSTYVNTSLSYRGKHIIAKILHLFMAFVLVPFMFLLWLNYFPDSLKAFSGWCECLLAPRHTHGGTLWIDMFLHIHNRMPVAMLDNSYLNMLSILNSFAACMPHVLSNALHWYFLI